MFPKASSPQSSTGFSGSGALSHVYIRYPPLRCDIPGARGLFYDDGNKLLFSPTSDQVKCHSVSNINITMCDTLSFGM